MTDAAIIASTFNQLVRARQNLVHIRKQVDAFECDCAKACKAGCYGRELATMELDAYGHLRQVEASYAACHEAFGPASR
jgi:hypothetical protein